MNYLRTGTKRKTAGTQKKFAEDVKMTSAPKPVSKVFSAINSGFRAKSKKN